MDGEKAADFGISVRRVVQAIETAAAGSQAGEYRTQGNSYRILVQLKNAEKLSLDEVLDLTLTSSDGEEVSLRNVVSMEAGRGPILVTTLTTVLGLLTLALGVGEGAGAQALLARAVTGGLTGSTLITLVLIPSVYSLFDPERKRKEIGEESVAPGVSAG